jgi:CheY-like chemotaxis protein
MAEILVAEDHDGFRLALGKMLRVEGHEVHLTSNGQAALQECRKKLPDLLITDIRIPEIDGVELISILKQESPDLPVIAISGGIPGEEGLSESFLRTAGEQGSRYFLIKPFQPQELSEMVGAALRKP